MSPESIRPSHDRLLIRLDPSEQEKTSTGILLTTTTDTRHAFGTVVASGPGILLNGEFIPNAHAAGDRVLLLRNVGVSVTFGSDNYAIVRDNEILAKVTA